MQTPVEIDFRGFEGSEAQVVAIRQHLVEVERRFGAIISGRVSVKAPDRHHRKGAPFEISIRLKLPGGREVDVSRTPDADERYSHFAFALGDAFRRAERQLRDKVERMQGEIKTSVEQPVGTVTQLFDDHGFLEASDGLEIYFHRNSVLNDGWSRLECGARVSFAEEQGEKGPQASTVRLLGKHGMR